MEWNKFTWQYVPLSSLSFETEEKQRTQKTHVEKKLTFETLVLENEN